jgi:soluble cytochrome b562
VVFSKEFFQGFTKGFSDNASVAIDTYLSEDRQEAREVAKDDIDLIRQDSARYNTEYQGYRKEMKDLVGKIDNDPDLLQYVISEYGYETAKKYITDMHNNHVLKGGVKPAQVFKLAARKKGQTGVTIDQLAQLQTTPLNVPKTDFSKLGGGMTRLFGGQDAMSRMIGDRVTAGTSGLPGVDVDLDDIPQVRLATDPFEEFEAGAMADPAEETERLNNLIINAKLNGDNALVSRLVNARDLKLAFAEVNRDRATGATLTTAQKSTFRKDILLAMNEQYKFTNDYDELGSLKFGDTSAEIIQVINTQADNLLAQAVDLMQMGYASELVMAKVRQAIFQNQQIGYDKSVKVISPNANINEDVILKKAQMFDPTTFIQDITKNVNFNIFLQPNAPFDPVYSESEEEDIRNILRNLDIKGFNNIDEIIDDLVQIGVPELDARKMINMMIK